jgi:hypothetical protein
MELFIEKDFLDDFYIAYDSSRIDNIIKDIITNYGDKKVFINYNENDFVLLKSENEFFALISNSTVPIPVDNFKESIKNSTFNQTLVFTKKREDWFEEIQNKGALCFCFDDYKKKIHTIIDALHFKIDLSKTFVGWQFLEIFKLLDFNKIVVTDGYILTDKDSQKIKDNMIPLLQKMVLNKEKEISIEIFTKDLNAISDSAAHKEEKARKRYEKLNSVFAAYKTKFSIILNDFPIIDHKLHDRYIATNFSLMDCGEGFNLMPHKKSDSQIISETIFEKYTYDRLKNITKIQTAYLLKLKGLETVKFKMFPKCIN